MMKKRRIRKRTFLAGMASVLFAEPIAAAARMVAPANTGTPKTASEAFVTSIRHQRSAAAIGRQMDLGEADADSISRLLCNKIDVHAEGDGQDVCRMSRSELRTRLAAAMRADFSRENVVEVDGWVVSETEGFLCQLAALRSR